jgi:hypothetical protein
VTPKITGNIILGDKTTLSLDDDGDGTVDRTLQPSLVLNAEESIDFNPQQDDAPEVVVDDTPTVKKSGSYVLAPSSKTGTVVSVDPVVEIVNPKRQISMISAMADIISEVPVIKQKSIEKSDDLPMGKLSLQML